MCQDPCHVIFRDFACAGRQYYANRQIGHHNETQEVVFFQTALYGAYQTPFQPRECYGIASPRKV